MMLHSFADSIRYHHSKSKNYVTIITGIPERKGATILGGIASVIISKIVRLPIELSPICVGKIPKCPGLNK